MGETGTGQQVAQLHDRYMMMMMMDLQELENTQFLRGRTSSVFVL
jgi:hypothetical protein